MDKSEWILFDAGLFIGALLKGDTRHAEAYGLVEAGRRGDLPVCTTVGILSEVYAALTWVGAQPPHNPQEAATAVQALIEEPSAIQVLDTGREAAIQMLGMAASYHLTARRIHDARHAATALAAGITQVYTYDIDDWKAFTSNGIRIIGPASMVTTT
jgi:predicted nucleic acid-binding protein